jgi:heptosyltransferase-2
MKIVVLCPNFVGDIVMATPAFRSLRRGFPRATIAAFIKRQVAPTLEGLDYFDRVIGVDLKGHPLQAARLLRGERPDLAVLFPNSWRSGLLAWLSGARRRIGYARGGRGVLLTDRLIEPRGADGRRVPSPIVEYYLEIPRRLGCPTGSLRTELATTDADVAAADRAWEQLGLACDRALVCLNTGGAYGPAKNWPVEHFATLAKRLVDEQGVSVLVICGPAERENARAIVAQAGRARVMSLADQVLGIGLSKACVRRSALLITTDSGPRHFAGAFRVPCLTLFGPTHIGWTRMHDPLAAHVYQPVPCGPCQERVCPLGHHRCMRELSPETVYRAAARMLRPARVGV